MNCRSLRTQEKVRQFGDIIDIYDPDVFIVTETWINQDFKDNEVFPQSYNVYRKDRQTQTWGGGVAIGVKKTYEGKEIWKDQGEDEIIAVQVDPGKGKMPFVAIGVYRAPNSDYSVLQNIKEFITGEKNKYKKLIIGGDLNLPDVIWETEIVGGGLAQQLTSGLLMEGGLEQYVTEGTRGNSVLDVFLVRPQELDGQVELIEGISDHKGVILEVNINRKKNKDCSGKVSWLYSKTDKAGLSNFLHENYKHWASRGENVEEVWKNFKALVEESKIKFIPFKILTKNPDPEFFTKHLKMVKRKCRKLYTHRNKNKQTKEAFKKISNELKQKKKVAHDNFVEKLLETDESHKNIQQATQRFYRYIRKRDKKGSDIPELITKGTEKSNVTSKEKAEALNTFYASVFTKDEEEKEEEEEEEEEDIEEAAENEPCRDNVGISFTIRDSDIFRTIKDMKSHKAAGGDGITIDYLKLVPRNIVPYLRTMFNVSINNGKLPVDWKKALVIPIHKSGNKSEVNNYRPVSLTSVICKIFEKLIDRYIRKYCEENGVFCENQHGFRTGYSCDSQLTALIQDLSDNLEKGSQTDATFIDLSKAFDSISHKKIMKKMYNLPLDKRVLEWIEEFLIGRTQKVKVDNVLSEDINITSGVPQGSVLGPLLFIIYINNIAEGITSNVRLFADDCVIYRAITNELCCQKLQSDIDKVFAELTCLGFQVNKDKSQVLSINNCKKYITVFNYKIGEVVLKRETRVKYLGLIIDSKLSWEEQRRQVVSKGFKRLHFVMRVLKNSNKRAKEKAYTTLVRPLLEYAGDIWDPSSEKDNQQVEKLQKRAARYVMGRKISTKKVIKTKRIGDLKVVDLKAEMRKRNEKETGNRADLMNRLVQLLREQGVNEEHITTTEYEFKSITEIIKTLEWKTLQDRRKIARLIKMYKAMIGCKPWQEIAVRMKQNRGKGRKLHEWKLYRRGYTTKQGRYSTLGRGTAEWNNLPPAVMCHPLPSVKEFRLRLNNMSIT
jgi:hypothetical protein